jgi:dephospho-CoA kinase
MTVIGLTGYAQTGKDTVGEILVRDHGFKRVAFADAVRECVYALNPLIPTLFGQGFAQHESLQDAVDRDGWEDTKKNPAVRALLQRMGTEVGREIIDPDIWIKIAERKAHDLRRLGHHVVFTDVRFFNEYEAIELFGGEVWRIERPGTGPVNAHVSDNINVPVDRIVRNDSTLDDLNWEVVKLLKLIE